MNYKYNSKSITIKTNPEYDLQPLGGGSQYLEAQTIRKAKALDLLLNFQIGDIPPRDVHHLYHDFETLLAKTMKAIEKAEKQQ